MFWTCLGVAWGRGKSIANGMGTVCGTRLERTGIDQRPWIGAAACSLTSWNGKNLAVGRDSIQIIEIQMEWRESRREVSGRLVVSWRGGRSMSGAGSWWYHNFENREEQLLMWTPDWGSFPLPSAVCASGTRSQIIMMIVLFKWILDPIPRCPGNKEVLQRLETNTDDSYTGTWPHLSQFRGTLGVRRIAI